MTKCGYEELSVSILRFLEGSASIMLEVSIWLNLESAQMKTKLSTNVSSPFNDKKYLHIQFLSDEPVMLVAIPNDFVFPLSIAIDSYQFIGGHRFDFFRWINFFFDSHDKREVTQDMSCDECFIFEFKSRDTDMTGGMDVQMHILPLHKGFVEAVTNQIFWLPEAWVVNRYCVNLVDKR